MSCSSVVMDFFACTQRIPSAKSLHEAGHATACYQRCAWLLQAGASARLQAAAWHQEAEAAGCSIRATHLWGCQMKSSSSWPTIWIEASTSGIGSRALHTMYTRMTA